MSHTIDTLYPADSTGAVMRKRTATDSLFTDTTAVCAFRGLLDRTIRYVEDFQLLDPENWSRFVNQYAIHSDSNDNGWRGEYWGKMMRGAAFTYAYTKNPDLMRDLTATVEDMIEKAEENGRISSYSVEAEFHGWDLWCRKYVLLGMQYYLEICEDEALRARIVKSMCGQVDYIMTKIGPASEGKTPITRATANWRGLNSSSLLEPIVRLYDITGEKKYFDFATYIVNEGGTSICNIFELAYEDNTDPYQYPVTKAYEMISCFEGLLEYYRVTGIEKYRQAVIRFGRRIITSDITVIGSAGCTHELFDHSAARQTVRYPGIMQETCVTVTWMKFCWQLLMISGDPVFADCFEQSLYNAYLGSVNTEKIVNLGALKRHLDANPAIVPEALPFDSYSELLPGTRGRGIGGLKIMPDNHYYGCCACIGSAGTGMIGKIAAMLTREGIALNLYIPGTIETKTPSGQRVVLETSTDYPVSGEIAVTVGLDADEEFALSVRIPAWSECTSVLVNGEKVKAVNGYTTIRRLWKNGDRVTITLDMRAHVIHPISNPRDMIFTDTRWADQYAVGRIVIEPEEAKYHIAIRRGPLTLARDKRLDGVIDEAVDIVYDEDGVVELEPSDKAGFDRIVEFSVPQVGGKKFTVVDYSSAGKTWSEESKYGCWLPTREYWR